MSTRFSIPAIGRRPMAIGILGLAVTALLAVPASAAGDGMITSLYTSLEPKQCRTLPANGESGDVTLRCPGAADYRLLAIDSDSRMSVTLVFPDKSLHPLDFWTVVTSHFSRLGGKAEWRVRQVGGKQVPIALITELNVMEDPESSAERPYLIVAKIGAAGTCVTDKILRGDDAQEQARTAADAAAASPCLGPAF
jgi:hypothetical protein